MYRLITVCALSVFTISAATAKEKKQVNCGTTTIECIYGPKGLMEFSIVGNCHYTSLFGKAIFIRARRKRGEYASA